MTQTKPAQPTVELIPLHGAVVTGQPMTLDVLVRITPPTVQLDTEPHPP
jgi:Ca-activated chloride channel family protein